MEYIFICTKKDLITEKNNGIKNLRQKKFSAKKWRFGEVLLNLFIYEKNLSCKKYLKMYVNL